MEMVLRCVLKSVEDVNKRVDVMGKQILKSVKLSRRSMGLAIVGTSIAIVAYIRVKALEERVSEIEDILDSIPEEIETEEEMEE